MIHQQKHTGVRVIVATFAARATIWIYSVYAVLQGAGVLYGGIGRWNGPTYQYLRQIPGNTTTWGLILLVGGLTTIVGSLAGKKFWGFWVKAAGLCIVIFWELAFGMYATWATFTDARAGTTGGPAHLVIALAVVILVCITENVDDEEDYHA